MATIPAVEESHVFINCPFDDQYKKLFDAAIFAIHDLGFQARHALIHDGNNRLTRIAAEIARARYSIHDISRVELSGSLNVPRFNMPFEAGIAYAMHQFPHADDREHSFLFLDSKPYRYQASLSDAGGFDAKIHNKDPEQVVSAVREFLRRASGRDMLGSTQVWLRYQVFLKVLAPAAKAQGITRAELTKWSYAADLQNLMARWIAANPPA